MNKYTRPVSEELLKYECKQLEYQVVELRGIINILKPHAAKFAIYEMMAVESEMVDGLLDQLETTARLMEEDLDSLIARLCQPEHWHILKKVLVA